MSENLRGGFFLTYTASRGNFSDSTALLSVMFVLTRRAVGFITIVRTISVAVTDVRLCDTLAVGALKLTRHVTTCETVQSSSLLVYLQIYFVQLYSLLSYFLVRKVYIVGQINRHHFTQLFACNK